MISSWLRSQFCSLLMVFWAILRVAVMECSIFVSFCWRFFWKRLVVILDDVLYWFFCCWIARVWISLSFDSMDFRDAQKPFAEVKLLRKTIPARSGKKRRKRSDFLFVLIWNLDILNFVKECIKWRYKLG